MIPLVGNDQEFVLIANQIDEVSDTHILGSDVVVWHDDCSNTSSFPDLADGWYNGAMGSIASSGSYLYATDYGSASGSHGPVYYHTFNDLTINQLHWIEAEIELDSSSALGAAAIMLYDSEYRRVAMLDVADSWTASDVTVAYAGWYDVDFNAVYTPKEFVDAVSEPYHESLRIEVNTTGIYGLIPRIGDFKMLDAGEVEWDRDISYLCVQFRTKDFYTTCQTMRIHDIKMQYQMEIDYSWHNDGSNLEPFENQQVHLNWYNLLDWSNGTWASSGHYLYPQSIDSASDWHGPTYVAELDQTFTLASLTSFSVAIEAINDVSSYCGKHTVYLADDDFDLILGVHVNDAWTGAQQGGVYGMHRFKNYTGTDNGPPSATSFSGINDTLSFRVEPGIGVYSYNPFYGETLICDWNATEFSRNVTYVILMSAQLDSYTLMPFRVHDILLEFKNFTADISALPVITPLSDFSYEYGDDVSTFEWVVTDDNPSYYWIMDGAIPVAFGPWDGLNIPFDLEGLPLGTYNFTLIIQDDDLQFVMDSVIITIEDTTDPMINHPLDLVIPPNNGSFTIPWTAHDLLNHNYEVYQNGTLVDSGSWDNTGLSFDIPSLDVGVYEFELVVFDTSGNSASDSVLVFVLEEIIPPGLSEFVLVITIGSGAVIIIIVGVICRSRGPGGSLSATEPYDW
jgi:hypothetical protein